MIIWFALMIPLATAAVLYWRFHHRVSWQEVLLLVGAPTLLVALSKLMIDTVVASDTEFWGGWATKAEYFEDWNERVSCRHPKYRTETYRGSDGKTHTRRVQTGYQHPYDVDYHPPRWGVATSNGDWLSIPSDEFEQLCRQFGNRTFVELHRHFHTDDGDKYEAVWDGRRETIETVTTTHRYENKVAVADSVFAYSEVNPKDFGLFEYPSVEGHRQTAILGDGGQTLGDGRRAVAFWNATLGRRKQVRLFVLVFKGQPRQAWMDQEAYWKGGNKNEFVTCVGVDGSYSPTWCHVFSWSEVEELKIDARNRVMEQKTLDLAAYADWLGPQVQARFVRKPFADFDYLTVEPPFWAVLLVFLLTLGACGGFGAWVVLNEFPGDRGKERM